MEKLQILISHLNFSKKTKKNSSDDITLFSYNYAKDILVKPQSL